MSFTPHPDFRLKGSCLIMHDKHSRSLFPLAGRPQRDGFGWWRKEMQFDFLVLSYPLPRVLDYFPKWKDAYIQAVSKNLPWVSERRGNLHLLCSYVSSLSPERCQLLPPSARVIFSDTHTEAFCLVVPHTEEGFP